MNKKFDVIIIGSGAGGATMAYKLAPTGKRILIIERGDFIPAEKENWDSEKVFKEGIYTTDEKWLDKDGEEFQPGQHYNVGGNTKFYGAALLRFREEDFKEVTHKDGISPAWPLNYEDFKPFYNEAEHLYNVHGTRNSDPTEPYDSVAYPYKALPHEPRIQELYDDLTNFGLKPFPLPIGLNELEHSPASSPYVIDRFDGYPDPTGHKADAQNPALERALTHKNVSMITNAKVFKLSTKDNGKKIDSVHVEIDGTPQIFTADVVVLSAGAVNSAVLLLKSASAEHPNGLANSSDMVGRNYMFHNNSAMIALSKKPNPTKFGKTFALNDFYWGSEDYDFPMGHIQMLGKSDATQISGDSPIPAPEFTFELMAEHAVDFWLTTEDLPQMENRVTVVNDQIKVSYTKSNEEPHEKLIEKLKYALDKSGKFSSIFSKNIYFSKNMDVTAVAHQNGTLRFGKDPKTSVLDTNCQTHDVENLYVVDGSFFVSSSAVNPALTIMAMALRVGEHIKKNVL